MTDFQFYDLKKFPFMAPQGPTMPVTEAYVSIPPALWIRDTEDALWTLGFDYNEAEWRGGKYEYDIVRNGVKTGHFGRIIEYRKGTIKVFGSEGWRIWNGKSFI